MTQRTKAPLAALAAVAVLAACGSASADELRSDADHQPLGLDQASGVDAVVSATEDASATMLQVAAEQDAADGRTTVTSPASLMIALSMLGEGAQGPTAESFADVFGVEGQDRSDAINALSTALAAYDGDPAIVQDIEDGEDLPETPMFHLANQVVLDDEFEPYEEYLDALAISYDAGVQVTDLASEDGMDALSEWVNENTGGLIPETAIQPDEDLRLVLQNAVLMVAAWEQPFDAGRTYEREYTMGDGTTLQTEMMSSDLTVAHASLGEVTAVRLPYTEGFFADFILPAPGVDPAEIDPQTLAEVTAALDAAEPGQVEVTMPTLDVEPQALELGDVLAEMGLGELMEGPDLSGISEQDLYLQQAVQQATLTVDADGTVAAAVTELAVGEMAAPIEKVEFLADRPYMMRILHEETQWPMFTAAVRDPS